MLVEDIVDLDRYPLNTGGADRHDLVRSVKQQLGTDGACTLQGFVRKPVLRVMATEAESLVPLAYPGPSEATPYFFNYELGTDDSIDPKHPLRRTSRRNLSQVAADLVPAEHLLARLYYSDLLRSFLSDVLECPVYRNQDAYQSLNVSVMEEGGCQQWHFDAGDMVTTLLLQEPVDGGVFEYVPGVRSDEDENFEEVGRIMDGDYEGVRRIVPRAGSLNLFKGHYALHRVTEVIGNRRRLQAILGYTTRKGMTGSLQSSVIHYGPRVSKIADSAARASDEGVKQIPSDVSPSDRLAR